MKRLLLMVFFALLLLTNLSCSDTPEEEIGIINHIKYTGAKFEYRTEENTAHKLVNYPGDVRRIVTYLNNFRTLKDESSFEEWDYRITLVDTFDVLEERQSWIFTPSENDLVILASETKLKKGDDIFEFSEPNLESLKGLYDYMDHYEEVIEPIE